MPGGDYVDLFLKLDSPIEYDLPGWDQCRGKYNIQEDSYIFTIAKDSSVDYVELVELLGLEGGDTFEGIAMDEMPVEDFMNELSERGFDPLMDNRDTVLWLKERMSFYVFEGMARTIGWWSDPATRFVAADPRNTHNTRNNP